MDLLLGLLPTGTTMEDIYIFLAGVAAFLVVFAVGGSLNPSDRMGPRIKALKERRAQLKEEMSGPKRRKRPEKSMSAIKKIVNKLQLIQSSQAGKLQMQMVAAGWRSKDAMYIYAFFQLITPIVLLVASWIFGGVKMEHFKTGDWHALIPVMAAYFGFKLPGLVLRRIIKKRFYRIQKALADTLDLMMICAEAGLSLAASLDRVARELALAYPDMADELALTSIEMGFLPDRMTALRHLQDRVDIPEVRGIVSVLAQTEKYGTPIAQALRVLAGEFRTQRMLRAEQKAARLPAIMTVPMIVFILPTLFIVIMSPAIIKLLDTWGNK